MKRLIVPLFLSSLLTFAPQKLSSDDVELLLEDIELELVSSGEFSVILEPRQRTLLSAQIETTVSSVNKQLGDEFFEDDLLIQLKDRVFVANYDKTQALLKKANKELEIRQQLRADNVASELELAEAEAKQAVAHADNVSAKSELLNCSIAAPYQGKVVTVFVEEHELVRPGQALAEVVDDSILVAKFLVPSTRLPEMQEDRVIHVYVHELKREVSAMIKRVGAVIDPASSMVKVEAEIDNSDRQLKAGMTGITHIKQQEEASENE